MLKPFSKICEEEFPKLLHPEVFPGGITLHINHRLNTIEFRRSGDWFYEIDMSGIKTAIDALQWIRQISEKNWSCRRMIYVLSQLMLSVLETPHDRSRRG